MEGMPMSEGSKSALAKRGIMESHQSGSLSKELINWADVVLTMTENHKRIVVEQYPELVSNVFTLKEFIIDDPEMKQKIKDLEHHMTQLELKRASFLAENHNQVEKYNKNKKINKQSDLEKELLDQLHPHQAAIDRLQWDMPSLDISDPFGSGHEVYEELYQEMEKAIEKLLKILKDEQNK
jgi:protein arginine phosphatase